MEIVERGSLTAAAESLGKSLPTVVRILAALEDALNARLFNRTTHRVSLTEEGRLYLERCRKILADIDDAELVLGRHQVQPTGVITITAPVRFGEMHVVPAVMGFLEQYLKKVRPNKAKSLIVNEGVRASVAANKVGYESAPQFSREFKRYFNVPPTEAKAIGYASIS